MQQEHSMQQEHFMEDPQEHYQGYKQDKLMSERLGQHSESPLERELEENEQLLWFGQPQSSKKIRTQSTKAFLILFFVFDGVGLLLLLLGAIQGVFFPGLSSMLAATFVLFPLAGIHIIIATIFGVLAATYRFTTSNTLYAITDQRIIILRKGPRTTITSFAPNDIGPITRVERPDGSGDLLFTHAPSHHSHHHTGNIHHRERTSRFTGIPNVRNVERVLRRTFKTHS
ncbi:MAG: hypothetical protein J2P36_21050 [Ktedonobacteraceae bacterium]|nr:hypothetical protein [Ktedonobacteraceae bacterium]